MADTRWDRVPIDAQSVDAPLSRSAIFLVLTVGEGADGVDAARELLGGIDDLVILPLALRALLSALPRHLKDGVRTG